MKTRTFDVALIGGGLSGLSAAVELARLGATVILLERARHFGGRAYSFRESVTGDIIDNGQHVMMGCYRATRRYLKIIQSEDQCTLQPSLHIDFLQPLRQNGALHCVNIPAPMHIVSGLLRFNVLSVTDRIKLLYVIKEILVSSRSKERVLDSMTVDQWLTSLNQSSDSRKYLWDVITVGALNNHPQNVSALMLFRVLKAAFLGRKENASLLLPRKGLSEILVDPAIEYIKEHGGVALAEQGVTSVQSNSVNAQALVMDDGTTIHAKTFISAVPWYEYHRLVPSERKTIERFSPSPIISIHIWFDRKVTDLEFAALITTRLQWMFNKSRTEYSADGKTRQHYSFVLSGAEEFIGMSKEKLIKIARDDLYSVLPDAKAARIIHTKVIKEKRATFIPSPGLEINRPKAPSHLQNLFLAGDWTATGYPATIEGAIQSGCTAAKLAAHYLKK